MSKFREIRCQNINNVIVGNLNINSLSSKHDDLKMLISGNFDIFIITETKLDNTFPSSQFFIEGFSPPYRLDRNRNGGGIMIFVREDIPSKLLTKHVFPDDIEGLFLEINFRKTKWLLYGTYHPPSQCDQYFFDNVDKALDVYIGYENLLLVGDFNAQEGETIFDTFLYQHELKAINKQPTCYKNVDNPSCVDIFLTNKPKLFFKSESLFTGLSDCHKLVLTVFKTTFSKSKPKEITYRDYKDFNAEEFNQDLSANLCEANIESYRSFENIFLNTLGNHAPTKKKLLRANHAPYVTKKMRKAIMKRSYLEKDYFKKKTTASLKKYKQQKNFCSRLYKKERKSFYNNLDPSVVSDNKTFWKNIQPFFSEKRKVGNKITLVQESQIISDDKLVSEEINSFFKDAASSIDIAENFYLKDKSNAADPIDRLIDEYKNHPSILTIKSKMENTTQFSFKETSLLEIENEIKDLDPKKAITFQNIPPKILKLSINTCSSSLQKLFNNCLLTGEFPVELKWADITPIFKKGDPTLSSNYRPISVLPLISKIFERLMQNQLIQYFDDFLSPYLCGYRKRFSAQHAMVSLIEKWKNILDKNGYGGGVLMDLSKAFDTLNHDLLIAKLHAYGLSRTSLKLLKSYLSNRFQRTKINSSFSSWSELALGVPQGSVLGPLLFNIYINDLFYITNQTEVCNYADDTTFHACDLDLQNLIRRLEHDSIIAVEWFESNYMKLNQDKCHLIISGHKHEAMFVNINEHQIWESREQKLLGIVLENTLKFENHLSTQCKKAGQKLSALIRISKFLKFNQKRTLMKAFIEGQFGYCPLLWMFSGKTSNNRINKLHERALRVVYSDYNSTFDDLLRRDGSVSIHDRNIRILATELFKVKNNLSNHIMNDIFELRNLNYNIRSQSDFLSKQVNTVNYGLKSLKYLGPKIWNFVPFDIRESQSLHEFRRKIKLWVPENCPCPICRVYIHNLGYI